MKELADGTSVVARMYYYLLDFNDMTHWEFIRKEFHKNTLKELNKDEFIKLYIHATNLDLEKYK